MPRISCLAAVEGAKIATLIAVIEEAGGAEVTILAQLDVVEIRNLDPTLLVCDIDGIEAEPLERVRQIRFVLPVCVIVVYTAGLDRSWGLACHLAGANGILSKASSRTELLSGVRAALGTGCFTDPRLRVA